MKNKDKKKIQEFYARENINIFLKLLEDNFNPDYNSVYIKQILEICKSFNIRLLRNEKLKFCKKCLTYFNVENREIRINSNLNAKEYICKNCGFTKRFKYK